MVIQQATLDSYSKYGIIYSRKQQFTVILWSPLQWLVTESNILDVQIITLTFYYCFYFDVKNNCLFLFFLLVEPPRSQSLLIMGWCSSILEHRLRLPLDSGPIFNLSLLRLGYNPVYLRLSRVWSVFLLRLRPAPLRPTGATGSQ